MNLLPHKRTLCLSNLTGSLSRLVSSTTGVKCQCFLFNQCFILGLYFNGGDKTEFECLCRYIFCPFLIPCLCYVNLNNLFSICTNSLEKCAVHLLQDTTAVLTLHQTKTTLTQPKTSFYYIQVFVFVLVKNSRLCCFQSGGSQSSLCGTLIYSDNLTSPPNKMK